MLEELKKDSPVTDIKVGDLFYYSEFGNIWSTEVESINEVENGKRLEFGFKLTYPEFHEYEPKIRKLKSFNIESFGADKVYRK